MKLLIAGCSFSQSQRDTNNKLWSPWSDMINGDFVQEEVNVAQSSYGQGMIAQSIINACEVHNYKPDLAIVQWSAVQRAGKRLPAPGRRPCPRLVRESGSRWR